MAEAGYSGTPLARRLGLKDGHAVAFCAPPDSQRDLLSDRAHGFVEEVADAAGLRENGFDDIHMFTDAAKTVEAAMPVLRDRIKPDGMIWMSWPKKASKVPTDVTEDTIRNAALADVLVDVKVCAVDAIWSGLKLVVRKDLRAGHVNAGLI